MGFYFRKTINLGGFRINLSKSGIGYSYGIKGFRISTSPRGTYAHIGSCGFYYKERLDIPSPRTSSSTPNQFGSEEIKTADVNQLVESSSQKVLSEINTRKEKTRIFPLMVGVCILGAIVLLTYQALLAMVVVSLFGIALSFITYKSDYQRRTTSLLYVLEGDAAKRFSDVQLLCHTLSRSQKIWRVESQQATWDWKRNAGASSLIRRREVSVYQSLPPYIEANIQVWCIDSGELKFYFFPDHIFVLQNGQYGAVSYESLKIDFFQSRFIEDGSVPSDARTVDYTWQYVRRDGGPDRRFTNNRQLPTLLYAHLEVKSTSGLNIHFQVSSIHIAEQVANIFAKIIQKPSQEQSYKRTENSQYKKQQSNYKTSNSSHKTTTPPITSNKETNAYNILGVSQTASMEEIAAAYKQMAQKYHPDKVANLGSELRELAEQKMKEINVAYDVLKRERRNRQSGFQQTKKSSTENRQPQEKKEHATRDELYFKALVIIIEIGRASTSILQRRLSIGYGRATQILEQMERDGLVSSADGAKPRKVLQFAYELFDQIQQDIKNDQPKETFHTLSILDICSPEFMQTYTDFVSLESMFSNSGFQIKAYSDIDAIPKEIWDSFIYDHTKFTSWHQMKKFALDEYCFNHGIKAQLE